ncbi:DUF5989 family protein [Schlesneria sp.]|uniref:DUF5989 family protein n=1 Tax=Schlesneria sp. TaxID=2762018 RepID=UPI002F17211B
MPNGYNASNSTEFQASFSAFPYLRQLSERRERDEIRQLTSFGLTIGWLFFLLGGFCWFCVVSPLDGFWHGLMLSGLALMGFGTLLPQALYWPHRIWMSLAHFQGRLVMTLLLTVFYFLLISPLGWWERLRHGNVNPFYSWTTEPPPVTSAWQDLPVEELRESSGSYRRLKSRPLISLFAETFSFFARRGHYLLLPILVLLLVLGLVLFFVQSSALAPFIYTIG